jgi:GNAT superfamily N-acetyltransferase
MIERFSVNHPEAGAKVMQSVAADLRSRNIPLWVGVDLSPASLCPHPDDLIVTAFIGELAVAAMVFSDWDPEFWPEYEKGSSTFVHKLAVLPPFQGKGLSREMLDYAAALSRERGVQYTRLDCAADRPKLCAVYESAGYIKVAERVVEPFATAFFERSIEPVRG